MSYQGRLTPQYPTFCVRWLTVLLLFTLMVNARAQVTAIRAGRLVDPATGAVRQNQVLLIEGGKIKEVGANVPIPPGASVVDLSHETLLPGLFDCHTHLCLTMMMPRGPSDREFYEALLLTITANSTAYRALQGVPMPGRCWMRASRPCGT